MMKKEWYIFQGTHHKGPFSKNDLLEFYKSGSLKRETLLWREEESAWEPLHKISELSSILDETSPDVELPESIDSNEEENFPDEVPPPLPSLPEDDASPLKVTMKKRVLAKMPEKFKDPTRLDLPPVPELMELLNGKTEKRFDFMRFKWAIAFILVVTLFLVTYFAMKNFSSVPQSLYIRGLNPQNLERLEEIIHKPYNNSDDPKSLAMDFALTVDGKEVWLTSNLSGNALLQVTLNSKANRVLGNEEVIVESRARLVNHQAKFHKIRLLKGNNFIPGEYTFKVKGKKIFWLNEYIPSLQRVSFFNRLNKEFIYEGETIIYSGSKTDFEYRLIEFRKELIGTILKPYEEKLEKINTLNGLIQKTHESMAIILAKKKPSKEISEFESFFVKEVSPMLQSIVNDSNEKGQQEIVDASKSFGESAMDLFQFVKNATKWTTADKKEADKGMKRLKSQSTYLDQEAKKVEMEIKKIRENP